MLTAAMAANRSLTPRDMANSSLVWLGGEGYGGQAKPEPDPTH